MSEQEEDDLQTNEQEEEGQTIEPGDDAAEEQMTEGHKTLHLSGMYRNWFLDYASYVILERAVPHINDGLKPVQRRILHAMKELDDGRFNKVANIIGHTMKYHPHGDASIGDALVQLGQKELLVETQGNWGNVLTGDSAAAPRYIEARLSKFASEVVFNPKTTVWKTSYDGRNREPLTLPVKFPLLLSMGVEGIAVGLASKILPHNFNELIDASIAVLREEEFEIYPDFPSGGLADFSRYNNGLRGGRVRIRARISQVDKKTLSITEIPFGSTTTSLIDSIIAANDKGKIKIKKIDDNTAENVEIMIHLPSGVSPDQTIDALYAFTNCEVSISPNACVITDSRPQFIGVKELLEYSTHNTVRLLKQELEIRLAELQEQWHFSSLEKIFIEERIYRKIEKSETWESVIETIDKGLDPFKDKLLREVTRDDIVKLTEIRIKRISKYNSFKADELIKSIESEIEEVKNHLDNLIDFAINYFRQIKKKYGAGKERKTEIRNFDTIEATMVAAATQKLYVNREEGFAGTSLRKNDYVCDCSDIDDIIAFREDGTFIVTRVAPKTFVGKKIIHIDVFKRNDDRTIYNVIYRDGLKGPVRVKRFPVKSIMRDREYDLTKGAKGSRVLYFTANPNGEAEVVKVNLKPKPKLKKVTFDFDFSELDIRSRSAQGNILTKKQVRNILKREEGVSTLGARDIWFDDTVQRLNVDERGKYLGAFKADDRILTIMKSGSFKLLNYDLSTHFDEDMAMIAKFDPDRIISVLYMDRSVDKVYIKRFQIEEDTVLNKKVDFIGEESGNEMISFVVDPLPGIGIEFVPKKGKQPENEVINVDEFIAVKSHKAKGKRVSAREIASVKFIGPLPAENVEDENETGDEEQNGADIQPAAENKEAVENNVRDEESGDKKEPEEKPAVKKTPAPGKTKGKKGGKPRSSSQGEEGTSQMELEF